MFHSLPGFPRRSYRPGDRGSFLGDDMAEKMNFRSRIMELECSYCDVIVKRWENLTENKAVLSK